MSMSMRKALAQEPTGTMYDEQERQKMLRLNREIREPQEPRLEWIYSGDKTQGEDYLLGKKVDGNASQNPTIEESAATSTVDLANKIREDPLFLIKKQEIEQQKRLLENPVRLKQIKDFLERQDSDRSSSHKKRRHHSRSRSRSPPRHHHQHHHHRRRSRSRSHSPRREHRRRTPPQPARRQETKRPEKLSRDERDRRMRQMLMDGAARTEQRRENVRKFKEYDDKEEKINEQIREKARKQNDLSSSDDDEADFIRPMMKQVVDDPSLKRRDLKHHHLNRKR